jgi:hypothetical protein
VTVAAAVVDSYVDDLDGYDASVRAVPLALAHHLDVLSERGVVGGELAVEPALGVQDDLLRLGQRGVADAEGGVVRHRELLALVAEHLLEVAGALAEFDVDDHVRPELDLREVFREVIAGRPERDGLRRDLRSPVALGRAAGDEEVDWLDDFATPEGGRGRPRDQLRLVRVVVEYLPHPVDVLACERLRNRLRDAVADGVRMTETLPLDDLDLLVLHRAADHRLDANVALGHYSDFPGAAPITYGNRRGRSDYSGASSRSPR